MYEDRVARLVTPDSTWIDVGGGRGIFPGNPQLARAVAERCHLLVSVDPSTNVFHNPYAHERVCSSLEEYGTTHLFDLATMRMVAEHIEQPSQTIAALYWLLKPGSRVIVYTVNRWSPTSIAAACTPIWIHHLVKKWLWDTEERDTFPTFYRMNTRRQLKREFERNGFQEECFERLDDCRTLAKWSWSFLAEILVRKALRTLRLGYPESCLLGIYVRN